MNAMLINEGITATRMAVSGYSAVLALCLRDKLGFGKKRAHKFLQEIEDTFDSIEKGYVTVEDIMTTIKDELDITIEAV
jgi:hypothetical protein